MQTDALSPSQLINRLWQATNLGQGESALGASLCVIGESLKRVLAFFQCAFGILELI